MKRIFIKHGGHFYLTAVSGLGLLFWTLSLYGCSESSSLGSGAKLDPLNQLSIRLNAKYWRSLEQNDFSLTYQPIPPKTIQLKVRYKPKVRVEEIEKIIHAARINAVGFAKKEFNLEIDTSVDMAVLSD
jgi:hypothetical protein